MAQKEHWLSVENVPTRILTWGNGIGELKTGESVVFLITGNPGVLDFYEQFLAELHEKLRMPVWAIGHAGHELPPSSSEAKRLYDLHDQIEIKTAVIEKFVPEGCEMYLIGHSVGAKVSLELLRKPNIERRIQKCFMLFPTIERIGDTPNAKFIKPFVRYFGSIIVFLSWVFTMFPKVVRYHILDMVFKLAYGHSTECVARGAMKLIQPRALENVFYLVEDEMIEIGELDVESFRRHKDKLKLYYGVTDGWSPVKFYENLLDHVPDIDAVLCKNGIKHAFSIRSSTIMASMISEWIGEIRENNRSRENIVNLPHQS